MHYTLTLLCLHIKPRENDLSVNDSDIFTDKYNDFIDANRMENASERLKTLKKLVRLLEFINEQGVVCVCVRLVLCVAEVTQVQQVSLLFCFLRSETSQIITTTLSSS